MRINILNQDGHLTNGFNLAGGTVNGPLELVGNPTQPMEAVTKQYIDTAVLSLNAGHVLSGTLAVGRLPGFVGGDLTSLPGSNTLTLSNTAVVPGVYTKVDVNSRGRVIRGDLLNNSDIPNLSWSRVSLGRPTTVLGYGITNAATTGATVLTGFLTLHASPVVGNQLATKSYVDSAVAGVGAALSTGDMIRRPSAVTPSGFLRTNGGQVSGTTFSALFSVIGYNFSFTATIGSGQPWSQQHDISLEPNTVLGSWSTAGNMPNSHGTCAVIVTRNRVFRIGGGNSSTNTNAVITAPINADGTLGVWVEAGNIPTAGAFSHTNAIVTRNRVYTIGGHNGGTALSNIFTAPINADGTLGAWSAADNLPFAISSSQALVIRNRVFVLGGWEVNFIFTAPINADGTLGAWTTAGNLPISPGRASMAVTRNRVFLLGGNGASAIFSAPINADGTLGVWTHSGNLPVNTNMTTAVVTRNRVFLLGGTGSSAIFSAPINIDGTLGAWSQSGNLPVALSASSAIVTRNRVFLLGGWDISTIFTATINAGLNDYSPFYDGTMVPTDLTNFRLPDTTLTDPPGLFTFIRT